MACSGSPSRSQSRADLKVAGNAAGVWISSWRSEPPASISATVTSGSSVRRAATTQPAEPAPTIT